MTDRIDTPTCNCFPGDGQPHLMACPEYWREAEKVWADLSAEVQRLRGERDALERECQATAEGQMRFVNLCIAHERDLASLRASHQEVVKAAYREGWNECIRSGPTDQSRGDSVDKCWESSDAKDALVTLDLGGAE